MEDEKEGAGKFFIDWSMEFWVVLERLVPSLI
jgi:hypothetical protein